MNFLQLSDEDRAATDELAALADRAAALVGTSILEGHLRDLLEDHLRDLKIASGETLHKRMFGGMGPLGSLSARINMGYMLNYYGEAAWRDLHIIRDIRNLFAHQTAIRSFTMDKVRGKCFNLKACDLYFEDAIHPLRQLACYQEGPGWEDTILRFDVGPPLVEERLKDPRERYLMCVMYYACYLKFPLTQKKSGVLPRGKPGSPIGQSGI